KKGKGYPFAEKRPEHFHGVDRFDVVTGKAVKPKAKNTYSAIFGDEIAKIAAENEKIVAITASMPSGTGLSSFQRLYPERLFDVGIAEGHAVTFAAGMAQSGLVPIFAVYSSFLQRSYDQIVHDVCIQNLPVVFAIDRAGIVGSDGETHQGVFDLSYLSHIPNLTVMAPRNGFELRQMLRFAVDLGSPAAIRYPKGSDSAVFPESQPQIRLGEAETLIEGSDKEIMIISVGAMLDYCAAACQKLAENGVCPTLINARFVKPIGKGLIARLGGFRHVFVVEDNVRAGGFGVNILEKVAECSIINTNIHLLSLPDEFIPQGTRDELFRQYGLDAEGIIGAVTRVLG
ncbi:MAG: 1-deoxy-D-xylulose-5-phosphate synthase, partial [Clostridiales bacterium]|nr:1-deoxy-D-xylulose-5-phosphate synthase [Clostridiales bacterium]